jgi:hypothetical protein
MRSGLIPSKELHHLRTEHLRVSEVLEKRLIRLLRVRSVCEQTEAASGLEAALRDATKRAHLTIKIRSLGKADQRIRDCWDSMRS